MKVERPIPLPSQFVKEQLNQVRYTNNVSLSLASTKTVTLFELALVLLQKLELSYSEPCQKEKPFFIHFLPTSRELGSTGLDYPNLFYGAFSKAST